VGVESCLEVGSGCRTAEPVHEGEILRVALLQEDFLRLHLELRWSITVL
jgi:hypothetical protein